MVVAIVALAVIPPKDLPRVMRTVGQVVGKMRRMAAEFQGQFMDAMREADLDSVQKELEALNEQGEGRDVLRSGRDDPRRRDEGRQRPTDIGTSTIALDPPEPTPPSHEGTPASNRTWITSAGSSKRSTKTRRPTPPATWRRPLAAGAAPVARAAETPPHRSRLRPSRAPPNEPGGHRRHQGAADGPPDRAARAAHPVALRVLRGVPRLLLFLAHDLQHPDRALMCMSSARRRRR